MISIKDMVTNTIKLDHFDGDIYWYDKNDFNFYSLHLVFIYHLVYVINIPRLDESEN